MCLGGNPDPEEPMYIDAEECADLCEVDVEEWDEWVEEFRTPPYIMIDGKAHWKREEVEIWLIHHLPLHKVLDIIPWVMC